MSSSSNGDYSIREFNFADDYDAVLQLWENAGPGIHVGRSDTPAELLKKLQRDPDLFLVAITGEKIIGSVMGGYDGRRGLVYHLAVVGQRRGEGIGTALMEALEERLRAKGCLKCYLLVVDGNNEAAHYYEQRGWQAMDVTLYGKELL
jgi:ribosomal protein S18 acetylase RimI-like enzyme